MTNSTLISNLQNPYLYDHPVKYFKLLETHISWVILTGIYVYKIKKPLDLEFLDFSSLEKRHHFCHEEIRLNKTLAPEIYIDVVSINGSPDLPSINGTGPAIEYAVRMREFPQTALFDYLLSEGAVTKAHVNKIAEKLAHFHLRTAICSLTEPYGSAQQVQEPVQQNFDQIRPMLELAEDLRHLATIEKWAYHQHQALQTVLQSRKEEGYIRECHGDVHLGNIALINHEPVIFDCIEFNHSFRWTDVMADPGFLAMDFEDQKQPAYANRLINQYLHHTGDYLSLQVINYYKSYRAMVRAKVALFQRLQAKVDAEKQALLNKYRNCIQLALTYTQCSKPSLIIMHGLSCSGKSTIATALVDKLGAIQICSDIERKRLAGLDMLANSHSGIRDGLYSAESTENTYQKLLVLAEHGIIAQKSMIVDASFLKAAHRQLFLQLAQAHQIPFVIIDSQAPLPVLQQRLIHRQKQENQISEAHLDVLIMQNKTEEPLTTEELQYTISINMENFKEINEILPILTKMTGIPIPLQDEVVV